MQHVAGRRSFTFGRTVEYPSPSPNLTPPSGALACITVIYAGFGYFRPHVRYALPISVTPLSLRWREICMHTPRSREICMHKLVSRRVGCAHASFQARTDGWTLAYYGSYWLPNLACMDVITSN